MRYKAMRLFCFFDLPTDTSLEKKEYRKFRKALIENGFSMLQYSVYVRTCPNREYSKKFISKLNSMAPQSGNVQLMAITEKQYNDRILILGKKSHQEEVIANNRLVVI